MPDYGKPIGNNLHWKSALDFFKEEVGMQPETRKGAEPAWAKTNPAWRKMPAAAGLDIENAKDDPKTDDTQTVTRTKKGGFIVIPVKKPATKTVKHGPGEYDFPKGSVEKENLGGQGVSDQSEGFDSSVSMPKPRVTDSQHPEGPGVPLRNGFTEKERRQLARDDRRINRPTYPQDPDATPSYPLKPEVRKRPSRPKKSIEESLLKLMKDSDQRLNAMADDKIKEPDCCEDEDILVADGDSKRPKSEVGTNDKMFKKADEDEGPVLNASERAKMFTRIRAKIQRMMEAKDANKATQEELPGFPPKEPELPEPEEKEPPTPDQLEHTLLKLMKESYPGGMSEEEWADIEREYRLGQREGPLAEGTVQGTPQQLEEEPMSTQRTAGGAKVTGVPADVVDDPSKFEESYKLHGPNVEDLKNSLVKLMKIEEPRSRQDMEAEFPVRHPDDTIDPGVRVSSRTGIDAPVHPDPTQPPIAGEEEQQDWDEAGSSERGRHGKPSGIYGVRPNNPGLGRRRTDQNASGSPEFRKIPNRPVSLGKDDMEKGGTFWGGSRQQNVSKPIPRTEPPWGRRENEASQTAGVERRIKGFREKPPKMGNLGDTRGQRKKSVENSLIKLMKDEESKAPKRGRPPFEPMPEVPGNEGIRNTPMSSAPYSRGAGGEATAQKVPDSTPFTVTDKPFDFGEHRANQQRLEAMWEAVDSGDVKLNMNEHADFAARMQRWGRDEALAREGLKHHPAVSHIASNRALRNSSPVENSLRKLMKATPEEDEEAALTEAGVRGLPSVKNPNRGRYTREEQEARDIYRTPTALPMTAGPIRGEEDKPEFVRDEFGHVKPSRAERNRALLTPHTDTSTDIEEPYSAGRTYEPTDQPAEGRRGPTHSQHVRREDRPVTAGERAEGAGIDTTVPFPGAMTQPNPEDMAALLAQEAKADRGGGENKGMKQPRKPIQGSVEKSLLKLMKEGELIPSKVGMTRKNATRDLEKVNTQFMQGNPAPLNPVARRSTPVANPSTSPTADQVEGGGTDAPNVGRMKEYEALSQAGNVADYLVGGALQGVGAAGKAGMGAAKLGAKAGVGGAKLGVGAGVGAAKKVLGAFGGIGGGKPDTDPSGATTNPTSNTMNYYSRDMKR